MNPAAFRRLCVETERISTPDKLRNPAAFRRLCVETSRTCLPKNSSAQPPLGGCVLKPFGCFANPAIITQPPLGGCVLKPTVTTAQTILALPAAFRRLCVETPWVRLELRQRNQPPLGGCVLKQSDFYVNVGSDNQPPLGGCVLKRVSTLCLGAGRCPAAFGRLCVETLHEIAQAVHQTGQPPSGGCVLKRCMRLRRRCIRQASRLRAAVC